MRGRLRVAYRVDYTYHRTRYVWALVTRDKGEAFALLRSLASVGAIDPYRRKQAPSVRRVFSTSERGHTRTDHSVGARGIW